MAFRNDSGDMQTIEIVLGLVVNNDFVPDGTPRSR